MTHKGTLLGTFIKKTEILSFLEHLKNTFHMNMERVFVYAVEGNDIEYLVSFKAPEGKKNARFDNASVLHVKNGCLFSINALNKLIEQENKGDSLDDNSQYQIDWDFYKDSLIILTGGELHINKLTKIEDKCLLLA